MASISKPDSPKSEPKSGSLSAPNQESYTLFVLPDELIVEILSRLPAKSLVKFKCVSKSWLSLISSSRFIEAHLAMSCGRDGYGHHSLIFTRVPPPNFQPRLKLCSVSSLLDAATTETATEDVADIDYPMKSTGKSFWVVGTCNGLVCVSVNDHLYLWNPCIKKCKKLPEIGVEMEDRCYMMFGFGYDEVNDDYKVVTVTITGGSTSMTEVQVYSLQKNSWSQIGNFKGRIRLIDSGQFASGNLHWTASHGVDNWKIVSVDLANESYGEMERPNSEEIVDDWTIGVLGGCFCVLYEYERNGVDVWVMKEYGVTDSWTKVVSVSYFDYLGLGDGRCMPVCLLSNGEVLLMWYSVLVLFDLKSNTCRCYPQLNILQDVKMFVESLVSPDIHDDEEPRQL